MGEIATSVGKIGFAEAGSGGVSIVFLHGVGSDKSVWRPQLEHFGKTRRAIAFDYPGYGESDFVAGATRDEFAAAIFAAMDALGIERAHICGLSLGGVIAIAMHARAPERCASLILADTFTVHPDGRGIFERSTEASRTIGMRALAEGRIDVLLGSEATLELRTESIETMAAIDPAAYRIGAEAVWLADQRERAKAFDVPTLILCGTEDRITPPALSEELATMISGAQLEMIDRAGHLSNAEQPAVFNALIDRFFSGVEQKTSQ